MRSDSIPCKVSFLPTRRAACFFSAAVLVAWALLFFHGGLRSSPAGGEPGAGFSRVRGDGLLPRTPNPWFFAERAYPRGRIPLEAWRSARREADMLEQQVPDRAGAWTQEGPGNIGGRITALAVDPANGNRVFAAAAEGGVLRSLDGGQHWTPVFDEAPSIAMGAVALDPSDPNTVYAGTGEVNPGGGSTAYGGAGLFRSTDGGDTWTCLGLEQTGSIGRIRVDPADPKRIFVAAMGTLWQDNPERGVYRTLDGGSTWKQVLYVAGDTGCVDLVMRPDDPDVLYAALWQRKRRPEYYDYGGPRCAVYRTLDGGDTWDLVSGTGGLPAPSSNGGRIGLALCADDPDVLYAVYADRTGYFDGLYRSADGGYTWTRTNDGSLASVFASYGWWFGNVRVHPRDPDTLFVLGLYLYRSTDGGNSYHYANGSMHVDHHGLAFGPGLSPVIYDGNDGGVYRSTNGGTSWAKLPDLPVTQVYRVALDAHNPDARYCGAQDNGTCRTLTGKIDDWAMIFGGDGFQPLVHPGSSNRIWAQYQYGSLYYSPDQGSTWYGATGGISGPDRVNWNAPLIQDPTDPEQRYFGTNKVYRSTGDTTWTAISPDLTGGPHQGKPGQVNGTLTTLGVSPLDGSVLWAGSDDGRVHVTGNGGGSWTDVSAGLPDRWITAVRADPFVRETAYVTVSGFRWGEPLPHVFRTKDLGATWEDVSGNLPEAPVNDFLCDPTNPGRWFCATDTGVYETKDEGKTWLPPATGLPHVVVSSLALDAQNELLYAGTYGRSFFSCSVHEETGAFTEYGSGLEGSGGYVPHLYGQGPVKYGGEITLLLEKGLGGTNGMLYAGLSPADLPFMGGTFLVFPVQAAFPVNLTGAPGVPGAGGFTLQGTAYVSGLSLYFQVLLADPGAVQGVSMSNGLEAAFP